MGKPKNPKSGKKGKGSVSSKDRSPGKKAKSEGAKTPESGADTPSKGAESEGEAAWPPPLNRPMMAPLVLPSDYSTDEPRRPSTIYVWDWDNIWFFPMGLLAIVIIVLGMVALWFVLPERDIHRGPNNASGLAVNDTANVTHEDSLTTLLHGPLLLVPDHDEESDLSTEEEATASTSRTSRVPRKRARSATTASPKSTPAGTKAPKKPKRSKGSSTSSPVPSSTTFAESEAYGAEENSTSPARLLETSEKIYASSVGPAAGLVTSSATPDSYTVEFLTEDPTTRPTKISSGESTS
ncbi:hypothetical protein HPB50_006219 [Hyalomma asiaticum]|uniref:Uncharacterized protein n=1 Tax=Hyalomma asiaticum TaxID=266040 RepID=A0ACB7RN19_HYAAI|nr:hypothetical protein HPB50_006219 [Hyalomma asiaticum]